MSNIDNHISQSASGNPYVRREGFTNKVQRFMEEFYDIIPELSREYDDLYNKSQTKPCKAFSEKMDGLAALHKFAKTPECDNLLYWYVRQPRENQA